MTANTYAAASSLVERDGDSLLGLETSLGLTPGGLIAHPQFFTGILARPDVAAAALLAVADVAGTRYFDAALAKRLANMDPVVTASGDRLRFESFSLCNGVHARLDLLQDGIESGEIAHGTTNVDINDPLRAALAGTPRAALMHLAVGGEGLTVSTPDATHVERKVDLPDRWIRGLAHVPTLASSMSLRAEMKGPTAARWLAALPKATPGPSFHLLPSPAGLRQSVRPAPGSVSLAGAARLSAAVRISRYATALRVFGSDDGESAWVWELPGARFTLVLTAQPFRGFSGEGSLLASLATDSSDDAAARLLEHLAWEPVIDPARLAAATGMDSGELAAGIGFLAATGKVGYDLVEQAWFHRELPWDPDRVAKDNPRLVAARKLVEAGAVSRDGERWLVAGPTSRHWIAPTPEGDACTCPWWAKHGFSRGPCKHALAVTITRSARMAEHS